MFASVYLLFIYWHGVAQGSVFGTDYLSNDIAQNPYLILTGPSRAVVMNESVIIEAELKVRQMLGVTCVNDNQINTRGGTIFFVTEQLFCYWNKFLIIPQQKIVSATKKYSNNKT